MEVLPNLSTVQLACARLGLAWQDARIVSVHSKDAGEWRVGAEPGHGLYALAQSLRQHDRLLVLTSPDNTPDRIARLIVAEGLGDDFQMAVAERLCTPDERVVAELSPHDAAQQTFADPNVVVLVRSQVRPSPCAWAWLTAPTTSASPKDWEMEASSPSKGCAPCRWPACNCVPTAACGTLARAAARWGSKPLACARKAMWGHRKNEADHAIAGQNARAFGVSNHTLVHGKAPRGWMRGLTRTPFHRRLGRRAARADRPVPAPPAYGRLAGDELCHARKPGQRHASAAGPRGGVDVLQLQAARSKPILHMHRMAAENPVWIVCAARRGQCDASRVSRANRAREGA